MNSVYKNTYGTWQVTTEGDVEGRSTKPLGFFTGHVDEIALYLADKCYYSLCFKHIEPVTDFTPTGKSVNVTFDIDSKTWDLTPKERSEEITVLFKNRPVKISQGNAYASFTISLEDKEADEFKRQQALLKLTDEDKKALGL